MRTNLFRCTAAVGAIMALSVASALACSTKNATVIGRVTQASAPAGSACAASGESCGFLEVMSATNSDGLTLGDLNGQTIKAAYAKNIMMPAGTPDGTIYLVKGDVDWEKGMIRVATVEPASENVATAAKANWEKCRASMMAAGSTGMCSASAKSANSKGESCSAAGKSASAGAGHCASKGADAAAASAKVASAGAGCGASKGADAAAASAGASCAASAKAAGSKGESCSAATKTASAGAGCCASKGADAAAASAGASCAASAKAAGSKGESCSASAKAANAGAGCCAKKGAAAAAARALTLQVNGMTCKGCVTKVQEALMSVKGVASAEVNLEAKNAVVNVANEVVAEELVKAIKAAGFEAEIAAAAPTPAPTKG